jgi:cytochrome c oxidase subunit IV
MKKLNICFAILTAFFCLLTLSVMPEVYSQTYVEYITYDFILLVEIIFSALFILLAFTRINYKYLILIEPILVFVTSVLINADYNAKFITFSQYINKG